MLRESECHVLTMLNLLISCPTILDTSKDITFKLPKLLLSMFLIYADLYSAKGMLLFT